MSKQVDFYFDYGSPTCYLAHIQLPGLVKFTGASINHKPVLLGGILKASGNISPMDVPSKNQWMREDLAFFGQRYGTNFKMNSRFPINTLSVMRGAIYAQQNGFLDSYSQVVFKAIWEDDKDMGDPAVISTVLDDAGIDSRALLAAIQNFEVKEALKRETEAAVLRGVFGAPALFADNKLFFGQDRIQYAQEWLST